MVHIRSGIVGSSGQNTLFTSLELVSGIDFSQTLSGIALGDIDFCHNFTYHLPSLMRATNLSVYYLDSWRMHGFS
jgi:hypothetical protein